MRSRASRAKKATRKAMSLVKKARVMSMRARKAMSVASKARASVHVKRSGKSRKGGKSRKARKSRKH